MHVLERSAAIRRPVDPIDVPGVGVIPPVDPEPAPVPGEPAPLPPQPSPLQPPVPEPPMPIDRTIGVFRSGG